MLKSKAFQIRQNINVNQAFEEISHFYDTPLQCAFLIGSHFEIEFYTEKLGIPFIETKKEGVTRALLDDSLVVMEKNCKLGE